MQQVVARDEHARVRAHDHAVVRELAVLLLLLLLGSD